MSSVSGVTSSGSIFIPQTSTDPVTVATALNTLRLKPGSTVAIADSVQNIQKYFDSLQGVAGRITSLATTDSSQKLTLTAAQYAKDAAILAKWGATDGNTVDVTGVTAANAKTLDAARPSYVTSFTVSDSSANIQKNLDDLQTLASSGSLRLITQTGAGGTLKITAAQLAADQDALGVIKNHAYSLAITSASVSDTLGLDGQSALKDNAKIKSIEVRDTTDAIEANLDALQHVGLRLKSISQTDADTPLTITGAQYTQDAFALGKIITRDQLAVIRASAAQTSLLSSDRKVVTLSVADTAANISGKWSLMQRLVDGLNSVEVTDSANAIKLTGDQLAQSETLLSKFADDTDHTYNLAINKVQAGLATAVANVDHVVSIDVADTADNVATRLDDLKAVNDVGLLNTVTLTGKNATLSMDVSRLQADAASATQGILNKIVGGNYSLAVTGVAMTALNDLASNAHIVAMEVGGSGSQIADALDTLYQLGRKVTKIQQSDSGAAIDVTQSKLDSRANVLAKIEGGYTVNVTGVAASKAVADARNTHVAKIDVADTGANILSNWDALRSIGETLDGVTKTDDGSLSVSAAQYQNGRNDALIGKFDATLKFSVTGASVLQATQFGSDEVVDQLDVTDDGSAVAAGLSDLDGLRTGGKLNSITLNSGATSLTLHAGQLDGAQDVLGLIKGGRYSLAVDQVDVADASALVAGNAKIATVQVAGDASSIVDHLSDLASIGHKLLSIEQTDGADSTLSLAGADFEQNKGVLAKIEGGYLADLTNVAAAKAAGFAANTHVNSLEVADTGAHLAASWNSLATLGAKLTAVAQSDSTPLQLTFSQWNTTPGLSDKFSTSLAVSISGVSVADVAGLSSDDAVQQIQVADSATAISSALGDLAGEAKLTEIQISDSDNPLTMSADTYASSSAVLGLIKAGQYNVALSDVAVADAGTLNSDAHVSAMDVSGASGDIAANFDALAGSAKVNSLTLSDDGGTLALSGTQILAGANTLAKITNGFGIAASAVSTAQLSAVEAVDQVDSIGISDTAANVSDNFDDVLALGGSLSSVHLTDDAPVLALSHDDWSAGTAALAKIDGTYQVDLSDASAADAIVAAGDSTVRQVAVADTADDIATNWSALVDLYNDGAGKLAGVSLTDDNPLLLTADQQSAGASMISALLPDQTIETVG